MFLSNTESVRDVQFSPHNPYTFSAVSDNGSVQLWDIRKTEKAVLQYTAHSGPVFACDWHPEMVWLATASRDKTIKVSILYFYMYISLTCVCLSAMEILDMVFTYLKTMDRLCILLKDQ